jgi:hypothetical protein
MPTIEILPITERVAAGAAWLDQHHSPAWHDAIDPLILDLKEPCRCVLGQLGADILGSDSAQDFYTVTAWFTMTLAEQINLGFHYPMNDEGDYGTDDDWAELTDEWRRVIRTRQEVSG